MFSFLRKRSGPAELPAGTRIYAVGDIHGRADLLDRAQARVDADLAASPVGRPIEVYIGDYIDRGPDSAGVLTRLARRRREREAVCLLGNHELYMLRYLQDAAIWEEWSRNGGLETVISYGIPLPAEAWRGAGRALLEPLRRAVPAEHVAFLEDLDQTFECGGYFFAHAGVRPGVALENQKLVDLLWIREEFLNSKADFGKVVVHGHSPVLEPEMRPNRIGIDTGAYVTGRLTCLVLEGSERRLL